MRFAGAEAASARGVMLMVQVSVTIPTYNRASLVLEALGSVLTQTVQDLEVVVIDDGSTDDTRQRIEAITDPRVRYVYKPNGGCASARNAGLAQCRGRYVAFLDSDDLWPEHFLEVMIRRLEAEPEVGCAYCSVLKAFPGGGTAPSYGPRDCKSGRITAALFERSFIWLQATVFRRAALEGLVFDESMRNGADTDAILRLSTRIQFLYVPDLYVTFRVDHGVAPRQDVSSLNCNRIRVLERFYNRLGGDRYVSASAARRKLSHAYFGVARNYYRQGCRRASLGLLRRAIAHRPWDVRLYRYLGAALFLSARRDPVPDWQMPEPLGDVPEVLSTGV